MKSFKPQSIKEYWKRLMRSGHNKISEGAINFEKSISTAKKDNWRRKEHVKKSGKAH